MPHAKLLSILLVLSLVLAGVTALADVPTQMSYQGRLTDSLGDPVADGDYLIQFSIYNVESSGDPLWTSGYQTVSVSSGSFTYYLGTAPPLPDSIFVAGATLYLGIKVDADDEMTPRTALVSSPFSFQSLRSDSSGHALGIADDIVTSSKIANGTIQFEDIGANSAAEEQVIKRVGGVWIAADDETGSGGDSDWVINGNDMYSNVSGDVGVGTTTPVSKLHVDGTLRVDGMATIGEDNTNGTVWGIVAGHQNVADEWGAGVLGGAFNEAHGEYSAVAGGLNNFAMGDYSFVGGGGDVQQTDSNVAVGNYSSIVGGHKNRAGSSYATVGGGSGNQANGLSSVISGGSGSAANGDNSAVGGGKNNYAYAKYSTVAGGYFNACEDSCSFVGGGDFNRASQAYALVGGGHYNRANGAYSVVVGGGGPLAADSNSASGTRSFVGGGYRNSAVSSHSVIVGGESNEASDYHTFVGGGQNNEATASHATVSGGFSNVATLESSVVGGGWDNTASGLRSCIPGGANNSATGEATFAAGTGCSATGGFAFALGRAANASHDNSFVWSDGTSASSERTSQFKIEASGGVKLQVSGSVDFEFRSVTSPFAVLTCSNGAYLSYSGTWTNSSSRNLKENFTEIDRQELLDKIAALSITRWNYKTDNEGVTHIGPVAEDFYDAFAIGEGAGIAAMDESGIALAAIQELTRRNELQQEEIKTLKEQLAEMQKLLKQLLKGE